MSDNALTEFVTARLDEDEQWAYLACSSATEPDWRPDHADVFAAGGPRVATARSASVAPHIARHDPARVLREVEAKRAILKRHQPGSTSYGPLEGEFHCKAESADEDLWYANPWPCSDLLNLAAIYSDHPGYRAEWAPSGG